MSWQDDAQGMEWKSQEDKDQMPRIRWAHGRKVGKVAEFGRWYTKADGMPTPPDGWQESDLYDDGGWQSKSMMFVPLIKRSQAFSVDDAGTYTWHDHWQKGLKLYTEVVCLLKGFEEPVIFACKGWTAGRVVGAKNSVISEHNEFVHKEANKTAKAALPPWAFWVPVGGSYDFKGNPIFVEVGAGQQKTLLHDIVLEGIKQPADRATLTSLYVGKELMQLGLHIRNGLVEDGWHTKRRGNVAAEQPATNTPQPLDDDSLAF